MNTWFLVGALQIIGLCLSFLAGKYVFKLPRNLAFFASILGMPAPLFSFTGANASYIYAADILGLVCFIYLATGHFRNIFYQKSTSIFVWTSLTLLLLLPLVSTFVNMALGGDIDEKTIGLHILRGIGYFGIACAAIHISKSSDTAYRMIIVGSLGVVFTCFVAIVVQFYGGVNTDLWVETAGAKSRYWYTEGFTTMYGSGFMGLYRGAIGAWAASVLAIVPIFLARWKYSWIPISCTVLVLFAGIGGVGSRQGLILGILGLILGYLSTFFAASKKKYRVALSCFVLLVLPFIALNFVSEKTSRYLQSRFTFDNLFITKDDASRSKISNRVYLIVLAEEYLNSPRSILGLGIQQPADQFKESNLIGRDFVYTDSELLWVMQQGGIVEAFLYYVSLFVCLLYLFKKSRSLHGQNHIVVLSGGVLLAVGGMLTFGHYFLLHVESSQAPVGYWQWAVLSLAMGTAAKKLEPASV